jgi:hypothetical protein
MMLVGVILYVVIIVAVMIWSDDGESTATQANRLCQSHQGVAQDGIEAGYVICRDGYVAER